MRALRLTIAVTVMAGFVASLGPAEAHRKAGSEARGGRSAPATSEASLVTLCVVGGPFHGLANVWNDPDPRIRTALVAQYPAREGRVRPGSRYCD